MKSLLLSCGRRIRFFTTALNPPKAPSKLNAYNTNSLESIDYIIDLVSKESPGEFDFFILPQPAYGSVLFRHRTNADLWAPLVVHEASTVAEVSKQTDLGASFNLGDTSSESALILERLKTSNAPLKAGGNAPPRPGNTPPKTVNTPKDEEVAQKSKDDISTFFRFIWRRVFVESEVGSLFVAPSHERFFLGHESPYLSSVLNDRRRLVVYEESQKAASREKKDKAEEKKEGKSVDPITVSISKHIEKAKKHRMPTDLGGRDNQGNKFHAISATTTIGEMDIEPSDDHPDTPVEGITETLYERKSMKRLHSTNRREETLARRSSNIYMRDFSNKLNPETFTRDLKERTYGSSSARSVMNNPAYATRNLEANQDMFRTKGHFILSSNATRYIQKAVSREPPKKTDTKEARLCRYLKQLYSRKTRKYPKLHWMQKLSANEQDEAHLAILKQAHDQVFKPCGFETQFPSDLYRTWDTGCDLILDKYKVLSRVATNWNVGKLIDAMKIKQQREVDDSMVVMKPQSTGINYNLIRYRTDFSHDGHTVACFRGRDIMEFATVDYDFLIVYIHNGNGDLEGLFVFPKGIIRKHIYDLAKHQKAAGSEEDAEKHVKSEAGKVETSDPEKGKLERRKSAAEKVAVNASGGTRQNAQETTKPKQKSSSNHPLMHPIPAVDVNDQMVKPVGGHDVTPQQMLGEIMSRMRSLSSISPVYNPTVALLEDMPPGVSNAMPRDTTGSNSAKDISSAKRTARIANSMPSGMPSSTDSTRKGENTTGFKRSKSTVYPSEPKEAFIPTKKADKTIGLSSIIVYPPGEGHNSKQNWQSQFYVSLSDAKFLRVFKRLMNKK